MHWIRRIDFSRWTFANFVVLAVFGALLRFMVCLPSGNLNYLNILHAHSHFAFAGWMFMALAILVVRQLTAEHSATFRWILLLTMICSVGMLLSFSLQGYKAVSIIFLSLFLFVTYWFGFLVYKKQDTKSKSISAKLLMAGIGFMLISSIGPLALGILKATGNIGAIYQNAIYFYLHFQMNGWMVLAALALIASKFLSLNTVQKEIEPWLNIFILSTLPLFFIFTLWSRPASWAFIVAFLGAFLNALSWFIIIKKLKNSVEALPLLIRLALIAISVKVVFQLFVCVPFIGEWTFLNRNLIIGYVHLITLACVTPVIINQFIRNQNLNVVSWFYVALTAIYLVFLFIQPALTLLEIAIPFYQYYLLIISVLYCLLGIAYYIGLYHPSSVFSLFDKTTNLDDFNHYKNTFSN